MGLFGKLASNASFNRIKGVAGSVWSGWRADASMVSKVARGAGRAMTWPFRGSFERGAVTLGAAGTAAGAYYGGKWLANRRRRQMLASGMNSYTEWSPRGGKAAGYIRRNFGGP